MIRSVGYALLPALFAGSAAHAQWAFVEPCNLSPDMDYLMVITFTQVGKDRWSVTRVVSPDWRAGYAARRVADRASLQEGKNKWFRLPDETPTYCEITTQQKHWDGTLELEDMHIFSLPKNRWWGEERNQGVAGYLREMEQEWARWSDSFEATVNVSLNQSAHSWLADYHAHLEREAESLEQALARREAGQSITGRDEDASVSAIAAGEDHFLAVATSPPAGKRIEPGEPGYFGIGWHTESQHDAGLTAAAECREQGGGSACFSNASGKSLRGGCVGLAIANWRDQDKDPERAYVVTSSSFRDAVVRELRTGCRSSAFGGKYEDTVVEHSCEIVHLQCAADLSPVAGAP